MVFDGTFFSNFVSTLVGTITGAALAYVFARRQWRLQAEEDARQRRIDKTLDMYDELTSDQFAHARYRARAIFTKHADASSLDEYWEDLDPEEKSAIRTVLSFFRRLQVFLIQDRVNSELAVHLLGDEFLRWYSAWLDRLVPESWETRKSIDKLNEWCKVSLPPSDYERHISRGASRRQKWIANHEAERRTP